MLASYLSGLAWASSQALGIEAAVGAENVAPWGSIGYKGTPLDLRNDLGYGNAATFSGRIKVRMPILLPNILVAAQPMKFDGTQTRPASFVWGEQTFSANVPYTTSLTMNRYDACLFYEIPGLKALTADILNVELGLNARILDVKGEVNQPQTGLSQSKSSTFGAPMGYLGIQVAPIGLIKIEAEGRAIAYNKNSMYDAAARAKFNLLPFLYISGGYHYQTLHIDQNDVKADFQFGGPIVEIGGEF